MRPGELSEVLADELRELAEAVRKCRAQVGGRRALTSRLMVNFDSIAERLEFLKFYGACRIVRAARAAFVEIRDAEHFDTVNYLSGKIIEMLLEASCWAADNCD